MWGAGPDWDNALTFVSGSCSEGALRDSFAAGSIRVWLHSRLACLWVWELGVTGTVLREILNWRGLPWKLFSQSLWHMDNSNWGSNLAVAVNGYSMGRGGRELVWCALLKRQRTLETPELWLWPVFLQGHLLQRGSLHPVGMKPYMKWYLSLSPAGVGFEGWGSAPYPVCSVHGFCNTPLVSVGCFLQLVHGVSFLL